MIIFNITEKSKDGKEATGDLLILNEGGYKSYPCISGPWGKGHLPLGNYTVESCYLMKDDGTVDAFKGEGAPWVAPLTPRFKTDRTGFYIHGDTTKNGGIRGTKGCPGISKNDLEAQKEIVKVLNKGVVPFIVLENLKKQ